MNFNMELPGLKGVNIEEIVEQENRILVYISLTCKKNKSVQLVEKKQQKYTIIE